MKSRTAHFILVSLGIAALGLAGCATTGGADMFGGAPAKPKTVVVTDFEAAPDVEAIDRGYSARMDRKGSNYPILERKKRTLARVNDEIVASIVVTLREAGLEAQLGSEEALTLNDEAAVVSGRLRADAQGAKPKPAGFGPGLGAVQADMTVSYFAGGGKKQLTAFDTDAKAASKPPAGKQAAARNAQIAAVLAAEKDSVKLSPDVEAQARRLGRAVGEKVAAYAKEQGWIAAPAVVEAKPQGRVRLPDPKPEPKRVAAKKPAAQAPAAPKSNSKRLDAPEDEEPPDTGPPPGRQ